ncbi:MAG: Rieske (2Fe-2S) protein [Sphingobacteriales bacterium]|nr:MAG: Rieske (2Fe-2S) protein [Sphingobacteriales bacterium]
MNIYNWHKVESLSLGDLSEEKMQEVSVAEKRVGLLLKDSEVFAFSATCPHAGVSLCDGWLDAQGRIVCPLHKYRFDPKNGRNTSGEGYKLRTYPVEIREGYIYIGLQP